MYKGINPLDPRISMDDPRISMDEVFVRFAQTVALRSVCQRRVQVGCVITNSGKTKVLAIGYNGPARGLPHDCRPEQLDFSSALETTSDMTSTSPKPGSCTCVHAEANALLKAPYEYGPLHMYTTLSPCADCARMILNSDVRRVYYSQAYRDTQGLDILHGSGIELCHFPL